MFIPWTDKYRPATVEQVVLPADLKAQFQGYVNAKQVPDLMLCGTSGVGKTTVAKAMLNELECDVLFKNASKDGNIDTLRHEIQQFASTKSMRRGRKFVILDEADGLNQTSTQPALRAFIETYAKNCGFILTCNHKGKLIEPIHSRMEIVDFVFPKKEAPALGAQMLKSAEAILTAEGVNYQKAALAQVIMHHYPDFRKVINTLHSYAVHHGTIDIGILANKGTDMSGLIKSLKAKNYNEVRKWVGESLNNDQASVFRTFYDQSNQLFAEQFIPELIVTLARYQYQAAHAVDDEINMMAFLTEVMVGAEWK